MQASQQPANSQPTSQQPANSQPPSQPASQPACSQPASQPVSQQPAASSQPGSQAAGQPAASQPASEFLSTCPRPANSGEFLSMRPASRGLLANSQGTSFSYFPKTGKNKPRTFPREANPTNAPIRSTRKMFRTFTNFYIKPRFRVKDVKA